MMISQVVLMLHSGLNNLKRNKMKSTEIRIGNFVTDEFYESFSTIIEVESINEKGINLLIEDDGKWAEISDRWIEPEYKFDLLFGIPLTEEWLLKFGFEKSNIYCFGNHKLIIESSMGDRHSCRYRINPDESIWIVELNYVHELQNIYFALTGEELTFIKTK